MTKINATSRYNRGDEVFLREHPEFGVFTVVDIAASEAGITNIKISRKIEIKNKMLNIRISDLTDQDIKLSNFKKAPSKTQELSIKL